MGFFDKVFGPAQGGADTPRSEEDVRVAACALFLEMANIDNEFSDEERQRILQIVSDEYGLSREHALELGRQAAASLEGSVDLWHFTHAINENYTEEQKIHVVELLWQVVYADGHVDAHEDYLVHKMSKLLRIPHADMIAAKLRVQEREKGSGKGSGKGS